MPEAIVFDLDDTLFPEREYVESGFREVGSYLYRELGIRSAAEELLSDLAEGKRKGAFERLLFRHGLAADLLPGLLSLFREHRPRISLRSGVPELLDELRRTRAVGVLTDGPLMTQRQKIEALDLLRFVDAVWINDELGPEHWKPSPSGYFRMEHLLVEFADRMPTGFCYVGDNPLKDFVTPRRRGWYTVELRFNDRLDPRPEPPGVDFAAASEVETVEALTSLLRCRP